MEEFQKKTKDDIRIKVVFEKKYNQFVDRIYGKITRERRDLDHIMNNFRKLLHKDDKTKFLNSQEILIRQQVKVIKAKEKKDTILINRISKDFDKEMNKDIDYRPNYHQQQIEAKKDCQRVIDRFYSLDNDMNDVVSDYNKSKYDESNQWSEVKQNHMIRPQTQSLRNLLKSQTAHESPQQRAKSKMTFIVDENQPLDNTYYQLLQSVPDSEIMIKSPKDKLVELFKKMPFGLDKPRDYKMSASIKILSNKSSLSNAKQMLTYGKEKQSQIQRYLELEKKYLREPYPTYNEQQEVEQIINSTQYFVSTKKHLKFKASQNSQPQISEKKICSELKITKETDNSLEIVRQQLVNLNDACKKQNNKCSTIIKLCQKEKKIFNSKYSQIQVSHSRVTN